MNRIIKKLRRRNIITPIYLELLEVDEITPKKNMICRKNNVFDSNRHSKYNHFKVIFNWDNDDVVV